VKKIAIFASGEGSNAKNICSFFSDSNTIKVALIATNNKTSNIIAWAKEKTLPVIMFSKTDLNSFEELQRKLKSKGVDYIVLAGFLLKIPNIMITHYKNKIINIHPSLLPNYGGKGMYGRHVHEAVLKNKEKKTGITIHLVNEKYDEGRILFQKSCNITSDESVFSLSKKVLSLEHKYFPLIIKNYIL